MIQLNAFLLSTPGIVPMWPRCHVKNRSSHLEVLSWLTEGKWECVLTLFIHVDNTSTLWLCTYDVNKIVIMYITHLPFRPISARLPSTSLRTSYAPLFAFNWSFPIWPSTLFHIWPVVSPTWLCKQRGTKTTLYRKPQSKRLAMFIPPEILHLCFASYNFTCFIPPLTVPPKFGHIASRF